MRAAFSDTTFEDALAGWVRAFLASTDWTGLALAAAIVVAAFAIGSLAAARLAPVVAHHSQRWFGAGREWKLAPLAAALRFGLTALLLVLAGALVTLDARGLLLLALALGLALGMLAFGLGRALGWRAATTLSLATVVAVIAIAATLGGLAPLRGGLDAMAMTFGERRISLLTLANFAVVAAILYGVALAANRAIVHAIRQSRLRDPAQRVLLEKLAGIAVVAIAVLLGIDLLGIDLTALAVFSGAFGLAVGFGLQKTLGNLIAGLILLMDRSIKPGDVIVVGDTFGAVNKIGVRAVSVITRDGKEYLIPNEKLMTEPVENWSYSSRNVRIHIPVGVSYDCDLALAQRLMIEAAKASPRALADPAPVVWLRAFGDSAVDHEILVWMSDPEGGVGNIQSEILNRLWRLFKEHGIEIPFPQRDLRIRSLPAPAPRDDA